MNDPTKAAATFPFGLFGAAQPQLAQGLTSGVDLMNRMIGQMPGASAIPGFLLPTADTDELDKRISDLRAAESWLDVNIKLLRATIQGLEVQRNTIAAIRSFGAIGAGIASPTPAADAKTSTLPPGWPMNTAEEAPPAAPAAEPAAPEEPEVPATAAAPTEKQTSATDPLAAVAAGNWLGYMQDQFAKVASAALASGQKAAPTSAAPSKPRAPAKKTSRARRAKA